MSMARCNWPRLVGPVFVWGTMTSTVVVAPRILSAQDTVIVEDSDRTCSECRIELRRLFSLRPPTEDHTFTGMPKSVVRRSDGIYVVTIQSADFAPYLFDSSGAAIGRVDGGMETPFANPTQALRLPGDSVMIVDAGRQRATVFTKEWKVVRQMPVPASAISRGIVRLADGRYVANGVDNRPMRVGLPLHLFDHELRYLTSFGGDGSYDLRVGGQVPILAAAGPSRVWTAVGSKYAFSLWDVDSGLVVRHVVRDVTWFPPRDILDIPTSTNAPKPMIGSFVQDSDGMIRVLVHVPGDDWSDQPFEPIDIGGGDIRQVPTNVPQLYDTVIEILDPTEGRLISAERISDALILFIDERYVVGLKQHAAQSWSVDIWEVVFEDN